VVSVMEHAQAAAAGCRTSVEVLRRPEPGHRAGKG